MSQGLSGGHSETMGVLADGSLAEIVEHQHDVELDLTRIELGISRTINTSWDAGLRIPYFIRKQTAGVRFPNGGTPEEMQAARRNGQNHHRTETYEGFADLEWSVGWRTTDIPWLGSQSVFRLSLGTTIPVGDTEADPWVLGDSGREHLHIQFGNGTVDPLIDVYAGAPITDQLAWNVYGKARLPFYRNKDGYRGPVELTASPRLTWLPDKLTSVSAGITALYFGYSDWEETGRDRNSGQLSLFGNLSVGRKLTDEITASLSVLLPIYSKSFAEDEDTLDPVPTFSLSVGYSF